ncbi:putative ribonuclease H-like domain-containing protein, partial [Tanacetum coccineum]
SQPPGFLDPKSPEKVYKVVKALYGLHQAPRAWYATLSIFLLKNGYRRGTIDKTLFLKKLFVLYRFQMSSMGELTFFLGLQVKQKPDGIFISQDKYVAEILKKFDFASVKTASKATPLFDTMLVQPTQDEGASSERLFDKQPSPSPAPTSEVPNARHCMTQLLLNLVRYLMSNNLTIPQDLHCNTPTQKGRSITNMV